MQQFSEIITVDGRELFFVFSRLKVPGEDKFLVMVTKDTVTYSVHLRKSNLGKWEIVTPSVPGWLKKMEFTLVQAIKDNTQAE